MFHLAHRCLETNMYGLPRVILLHSTNNDTLVLCIKTVNTGSRLPRITRTRLTTTNETCSLFKVYQSQQQLLQRFLVGSGDDKHAREIIS